MKRLISTMVLAVFAAAAPAQFDAPKPTGPEFDQLKKYVGTWDMASDMGGQKGTGTSTYEMKLGGLWLMSAVKMDMGGMKFEGHGMDSYDAASKKFQGVWVDNMITNPMVMKGDWDSKTKTLTMKGEGNGPDGKLMKTTITNTWVDDDNFKFAMFHGDAKEPSFTIAYKRKK